MARPWIAGGILLVAMETLADFGTVAVFNYDTLTTAIYQAWFSLFSLSAALKIAGILLLLVVVVTVLERHSRRQRQYAEGRNAARNTKRLELGFGAKAVVLLFCSSIFMLAFVLPLGQLLCSPTFVSFSWPRCRWSLTFSIRLSRRGRCSDILLASGWP